MSQEVENMTPIIDVLVEHGLSLSPGERIADVRVGQRGELVLFSLPGQEFGFTVSKITPIARAEEGGNHFRVEASLDSVDQTLRPGMEGVGKVAVDRRKLVHIWIRDMREWLTLFFWKWLP